MDYLCFKEGNKFEVGRALLERQMRPFIYNKLHRVHFEISPEDMDDAAPLFNIIDEEEDGDIDINV